MKDGLACGIEGDEGDNGGILLIEIDMADKQPQSGGERGEQKGYIYLK